jgi:hypothetical protein
MASLFVPRQCYSDTYYKYVDKNGSACFTDNPQSIPDKYKQKAIKIVDGKEYVDKKTEDAQPKVGKKSEDTQPKADNEDGPFIDKKQEVPSKEKIKDVMLVITSPEFFRPVVAIAIFVSLFVVIGKMGRSLGHKRISSLLRIALTVGILVFLFIWQAEKMADVLTSLKKGATDIGKRLEKKNKKAEDTAKDPLESENVSR